MKKIGLVLAVIAAVSMFLSCGGGAPGAIGEIYDDLSEYYGVPDYEVSTYLFWDILWELNSPILPNPELMLGPTADFKGLDAGTYNLSYIGLSYNGMHYLPSTQSVTLASGQRENLPPLTRILDTDLTDNPAIVAAGHKDTSPGELLYYMCVADAQADLEEKVDVYERLRDYETFLAILFKPDPTVTCPALTYVSGAPAAVTVTGYSATGPSAGYDPDNYQNLFIAFDSKGIATAGVMKVLLTNSTTKTWASIDFGSNFVTGWQSGSPPCSGFTSEPMIPPGTYLNHLTGCSVAPGQTLSLALYVTDTGVMHITSCETFDGTNAFDGYCASGISEEGKTGTVAGRVVDASPTPAPISGATVTFTTRDGTNYTATTGSDGKYSIANVPTGEATRTISAAGKTTATGKLFVIHGLTNYGDTTLS